jgi:hypothetical protein
VTITSRAGRMATTAALVAALVIAAPPPTALAGSGLRVEAHATWMLEAGDSAIRVAVEFTLTNLVPNRELEDGSIEQTYFDQLRPGLPRGAANVRADADGVGLNVITLTTDSPDGEGPPQLSAAINLPGQLFYQQTQRITLRFDLPGSPPRSEGRVRVNPAYAAFDAHAWGDPGLSSVEIRVDQAYEVTTFGADVSEAVEGNYTVFRAEEIPESTGWFVHVSARNDAALDAVEAEVPDLVVSVLSWPGDAEWAVQVRDLIELGLPFLRQAIGLDYGIVEELDILQARDPSLLGFAGWYLADLDRIEIGEAVDAHVVLHELTHIWFNTRLFAERWINEGMAEVFAAHAVEELSLDGDAAHLPERPDPDDPGMVSLADWVFPTVAPSQDERVRDRELFAYAASYWVMAGIADEVGVAGMRAVVEAAHRGEAAYVTEGTAPEQAEDRRTGWQRLLDLFEERAGATVAEALYREHVVTSAQLHELDARAGARSAYAALADTDPSIPWAVRRLMDAWEFAEAEQAMGVAAETLALTAALEAAAEALDLEPPRRARSAYDRAATTRDLERAHALAVEHDDAATLLVSAQEAVDAPRGLLTQIGLFGSDLNRRLAAARSAFSAEDPEVTSAEALAVLAIMDGAHDAGRLRSFWAGGGVLILLGLGVTAAMVARRKRRMHPPRPG